MLNKSKSYLLLLPVVILWSLVVLLQKDSKSIIPVSKHFIQNGEEERDGNHLFPNEQFYADRNYPAADASPDLYQHRLREAINYDKSATRSHRGLDYPWTVEGPGNIGGRVNTIAVHPFNSEIILMGYSQGGIYRTDDGGLNWLPVFDDQPSLSISNIAFDPHNANIVFATTGDVNISGYPFLGSGVYRSEDAGLSWSYAGLNGTGILSKVAVDPNDENYIYVGSMGYPSQKGTERGIFRSTNGGQSWDQTLVIDDSTGIIDLVADPTQPGRVFATGWTRLRSNKIATTIGPGTSVYRSIDFGATWENLVDGLPSEDHSRTSVEISGDGTLYVSYIGNHLDGECAGYIESLKGLYRSTDGGTTWDTIQTEGIDGIPCDLFGNFGWYNEVLKVNPENSQDISILGVDLYRTLDGGITWYPSAPIWWTYEVHADKHDLVYAAGQMFLGTDGGAYKCPQDQSLPWSDMENIPSTQFYRTTFNPHQPDQYIGGAQDNGTTSGNESILNEWPRLFGGDGFQPRFDPTEPSWSYFMTQYGEVYWSSDDGFNYDNLDKGLFGPRYWDMPFVMSSQDPKILFCASHHLFKINMRDSTKTWTSISPDLTRGDTILGNKYPSITAIAQSDLDSLRLYAGTQDGLIWTSPDGGLNWENITDGTPGYYVTSITCSTINPLGVFATYSGYRDNDHTPYIYRSEDAGEHWSSLGVNLPMLGVNNLYLLPDWNDDVIIAGTDGGVYISFNGGIQWDRLGTNFPYMPVYDVDYNPIENTIVAATFSRGLMTFPVDELDLVSAVDPISQHSDLNYISIYPTVASDQIIIDFEKYNGPTENFKIGIFDLSGHNIISVNELLQNDKQITIQLDNLIPQGMYLIKIESSEGSEIVKSFLRL